MTRARALRTLSDPGQALVSTRTPEGGVLDVVLRYDACELNVGGARVHQFEVSAASLVRLAWGILRWWCLTTLCGWRIRRWDRAMARVYDEGAV